MIPFRSIAWTCALGLAGLASSAAVSAAETDRAVAQAQAAADHAHEQLADHYRALWSRMSESQKSAFAASERAWLNGGRQDEERMCRGGSRVQPEALAVQLCRLAVTERRLAGLDTGQPSARVARSP